MTLVAAIKQWHVFLHPEEIEIHRVIGYAEAETAGKASIDRYDLRCNRPPKPWPRGSWNMAPLICQLSREWKRNKSTIARHCLHWMGEKWSLSLHQPRSIFAIGRKINLYRGEAVTRFLCNQLHVLNTVLLNLGYRYPSPAYTFMFILLQ